jgi:hypothetical protein
MYHIVCSVPFLAPLFRFPLILTDYVIRKLGLKILLGCIVQFGLQKLNRMTIKKCLKVWSCNTLVSGGITALCLLLTTTFKIKVSIIILNYEVYPMNDKLLYSNRESNTAQMKDKRLHNLQYQIDKDT